MSTTDGRIIDRYHRGPLQAGETADAGAWPERRLWFAVLESAMLDPKLDPLWLWSDRVAPMTFVWVCDALELDPGAVRAAYARRWKVRAPSVAPGSR